MFRIAHAGRSSDCTCHPAVGYLGRPCSKPSVCLRPPISTPRYWAALVRKPALMSRWAASVPALRMQWHPRMAAGAWVALRLRLARWGIAAIVVAKAVATGALGWPLRCVLARGPLLALHCKSSYIYYYDLGGECGHERRLALPPGLGVEGPSAFGGTPCGAAVLGASSGHTAFPCRGRSSGFESGSGSSGPAGDRPRYFESGFAVGDGLPRARAYHALADQYWRHSLP